MSAKLTRRLSIALFSAALPLLMPIAAHATITRVWVSGKGADQAGCGPIVSPCRSLQYAHDNTTAGGEIDVLDPAGYGSIVITKAISIVNDGAGVAGVLAPSGGSAITINAGASDAIVLRGLTIEGSKIGINGIVFTSGQYLTIANCIIQGFVSTTADRTTGNGIYIRLPNSQYASTNHVKITDTVVSNNGGIGVYGKAPSSTGGVPIIALDGVTLLSNGGGIVLDTVVGDIHNTIASQNVGAGLVATGYSSANLDQFTAANNGTFGIDVQAGPQYVWMSRSVAFGNDVGVRTVQGAYLYTYRDNRLSGNRTSDMTGNFSGTPASQ